MKRNEKRRGLFYWARYTAVFIGLFAGAYFLFFREGKSFVWDYDGIRQHFPALSYLGKYYREVIGNWLHGNFSLPMFDFSLGMGEDIITTLNFYGLGDPLTFLAALVPEKKIEVLYNFLVVFRMYLAGLSFSIFCRHKKKSWDCTLIGAVAYAFSGYLLHVAVKHPFFVTPMILLPLTLVGVDLACCKKKLTLLIATVFVTALSGFYFFYMNTVFAVVYAVVQIVCRHGALRRLMARETGDGGRNVFHFVRSVFGSLAGCASRCMAAYLVGTAMAAILFLPSVAVFLSSARVGSEVNPGNLFLYSADKYNAIFSGLIGPPRITWDYLGMVSLLVPALVLLFGKKKNRELKVNIIIWTALMLVPFGGYLLNGFAYPSGRFTYLVTFLYCFCIVAVLPELLKVGKKQLLACVGATAAYFLVVLFSSAAGEWYGWFGFVMLVLILVILAVGVWKNVGPRYVMSALALVTAVNIVGNGWFLFGTRGEGYVEQFIDAGEADKTIEASSETEAPVCGSGQFYRTDADEKTIQNASLLSGDYGVGSYFSLSNPNRIRYLLEMENGGVEDSMFKISGLDGRSALLALAGVRYYAVRAGSQGDVPFGFNRFVRKFEKGDIGYCLYENLFYLPLGATYDSCCTRDEAAGLGPLERQKAMLGTLILEKTPAKIDAGLGQEKIQAVEKPVRAAFQIRDSKKVSLDGDSVQVKKGGSITLDYEDAGEGELYVRLEDFSIKYPSVTSCAIRAHQGVQTAGQADQGKVITALADRWNWYFGRDAYLFHLGNTSGGGSCTLTFEQTGSFSLSKLDIYVQSMSDLETLAAARRTDQLTDLYVGCNEVSGRSVLDQPKFLFFSIPFSQGWRAFVDGEETEIYQANTAYMALELEPGDHQVKLVYRTPWIRAGGVVSLCGVFCFVAYLIWSRRKESRGSEI